MPKSHGQKVGQVSGKGLDWTFKNWFKVSLLVLAGYITYTLHVFVDDFETAGDRWMSWSKYTHDRIEEHNQPLGDLPSLRPQPVD